MERKQLLSIVLLWSIAVTVKTQKCSGDKVLGCLRPFELISSGSEDDIRNLCPQIPGAIKCFEDEIRNCPGSQQHLLGNVRNLFEDWSLLCKEETGETTDYPTCTLENFKKCFDKNPDYNDDDDDFASECLYVLHPEKCLQLWKDACPNSAELGPLMKLVAKIRYKCNHYGHFPPTTITQLPPSQTGKPVASITTTTTQPLGRPCEWSAINDCVWRIEDLVVSPHHTDQELMCQIYEEAASCLKKETARCPDYTTIHVWNAQVKLDMVERHCQRSKAHAKKAGSAGHRSVCVDDDLMKSCLLNNQMTGSQVGQQAMCLAVGRSESCIQDVDKLNHCNPDKLTRMSTQVQEQKRQCKQLGFPTSKAGYLMQPSVFFILMVTATSVVLHHFL